MENSKIFDALPVGAENAITGPELAKRLGLNSTRHLRQAVEKARGEGQLILSSFEKPSGYFRPRPGEAGRREMEAFYYSQRAHAIAILRRLKATREALGILPGQLEIDE